jgi:hypothetical protein
MSAKVTVTETAGPRVTVNEAGEVLVTIATGSVTVQGGLGDVVGPGSATNNALAVFDGTTGKTIKNGTLTNPASNQLGGVSTITASGSGGIVIEASGGTDIGLLGAGNAANVTWYGSHNFNAATASTIASFGASKTLESLSTATYPSLTELSYVKGATSAIQTQLNSKQASGNYIAALTGDVTASGPGSVAATIANGAVTAAKMAATLDLSGKTITVPSVVTADTGTNYLQVNGSGAVGMVQLGRDGGDNGRIGLWDSANADFKYITQGDNELSFGVTVNASAFIGGGGGLSGLSASNISSGTLALARGGTGASLADPDADRLLFWDDSAGQVTWLTAGSGLSISGTTITATGGGGSIGGTVGATDNVVPRADGTGGSTLQASAVSIDDNGLVESVGVSAGFISHVTTPVVSTKYGSSVDTTGIKLLYTDSGLSTLVGNLTGPTAWPDSADFDWELPAASGTVALLSNITGTNSGTNTGDVTLAGTPDYITISGQTITRNAIDLAADVTGTLPVANGGTGATTLSANAVLLGNGTSALQTVAPGTSGNVLTSNGTTWASAAPSTGANPAGSGSEIQFRSDATTFGAATNSSVSGGAITLGAAEALGTTPTAYLTLRNTTAAAAGAQQVSPSIVLEGQGWKTTATAASQTVRFRENVLPVQGTTNPSATWQLQSEINNSGTWTDRVTINSSGVLTLGTFPASIVMGNATFFGATNGPRFQVSSADIFGLRGGSSLNIAQARALGWSNNAADATETPDLTLFRDAANTLAQRNGTNAQTFRIYETDSGANDEYLEISAASGTNVIRPQATGTGTASVVRYHTTTAVFWTSGSGSPESVVTAPVGSLYTRTDGGAGTTLYVKESGSGSTGWVAK